MANGDSPPPALSAMQTENVKVITHGTFTLAIPVCCFARHREICSMSSETSRHAYARDAQIVRVALLSRREDHECRTSGIPTLFLGKC